MRSAVRQLVLALHQAPVMIVVLLIFGREIKPVAFLSIVGLFLIFINSIWIMAVIGMAGARMRDLSFTIEAAVPLAFFLTPVLWRTEDLKANHPFVSYNPFANALDLVRAPILGGAPQTESYVIMISAAVLGWGLMLWAFRYRHRIAFWVQ
jgi:lipopolysaccharide transport system permease protein